MRKRAFSSLFLHKYAAFCMFMQFNEDNWQPLPYLTEGQWRKIWTLICSKRVRIHHSVSAQFLSTVLQNRHFCIAKLALLKRKTHRFGTQNAPFWNAKCTVLERKMHRFRTQNAPFWNRKIIGVFKPLANSKTEYYYLIIKHLHQY